MAGSALAADPLVTAGMASRAIEPQMASAQWEAGVIEARGFPGDLAVALLASGEAQVRVVRFVGGAVVGGMASKAGGALASEKVGTVTLHTVQRCVDTGKAVADLHVLELDDAPGERNVAGLAVSAQLSRVLVSVATGTLRRQDLGGGDFDTGGVAFLAREHPVLSFELKRRKIVGKRRLFPVAGMVAILAHRLEGIFVDVLVA